MGEGWVVSVEVVYTSVCSVVALPPSLPLPLSLLTHAGCLLTQGLRKHHTVCVTPKKCPAMKLTRRRACDSGTLREEEQTEKLH